MRQFPQCAILINTHVIYACVDEAIDAAAETFLSGRISALKEMETLGKLMIKQDMRALGA